MEKLIIIPTLMCSSEPMIPIKEEYLTYTPWMYLHGDLESRAAYYDGWDKFKWFSEPPTSDGIYDCQVWMGNSNGNDTKIIEATAFLWNCDFGSSKKLTGLVVAKDDKESLNYAFIKFGEKAACI